MEACRKFYTIQKYYQPAIFTDVVAIQGQEQLHVWRIFKNTQLQDDQGDPCNLLTFPMLNQCTEPPRLMGVMKPNGCHGRAEEERKGAISTYKVQAPCFYLGSQLPQLSVV